MFKKLIFFVMRWYQLKIKVRAGMKLRLPSNGVCGIAIITTE